MATRPTVTDLVNYMDLRVTPTGNPLAVLSDTIETALEVIEARLKPDVIPEDVTAYPHRVRTAVLMQASRLAKRRTSPEGVFTFGDSGAIRVGAIDGDIENLLTGLIRIDGFA